MTRTQLITKALQMHGNTGLSTVAIDWLDRVLWEMEAAGYWKFLETQTTYQTENNTQSVAFSTSKWPSAAITDYSKGLALTSDEPRQLQQVSKQAFDEMDDDATGNPRYFALWNKTVYLYPTPVTGSLPLITVRYFKEMTHPTQDADDMETVCGILPKWQGFVLNGVVAEGLAYSVDERAPFYRQLWKENLLTMLVDNEDISTYKESRMDRPSMFLKVFGMNKEAK